MVCPSRISNRADLASCRRDTRRKCPRAEARALRRDANLYLSTLLTLGDTPRPTTGDGQGNGRCLDVRHTTSSTFKRIKVGQVAKSRCYSSEPHDLSAARAMRRPGRVFTRGFVTHGRNPVLEPQCVRSRPAGAVAHQCGNDELTNKQKNSYRIRIFGDDHHRRDLYSKHIRRT